MNSKMKKSLLFAFLVCVLTVLTVFSASAKTVTKNKLVYEVSEKTATLIDCKSNAKKIKVPSKVGKYKVTAIGSWAFSGKKKLQSVELPKTVTKIGEAAFNECISLKKIVIPSKVTRISSSAFWYCTNLETVVIPKSVTRFGKNVFEGCDKLTAYVVKGSKGEKYIKKQKHITLAYRYMTSLKLDADSVTLDKGDTYKFTVTKKPKKLYNSKVSYSSNNEKAVKVSSKGVITALAPGKAVITCKAKDGSGKKAVCTVTVKAKKAEKVLSVVPTAPVKVTGLRVTSVSDSSVSVSWNKVSGADGYKVFLFDDGAKTYTHKQTVASNEAEIKGLEAGRDYSFAVKAYKRNYYSGSDSTAYSDTVKGKTLPGKVSGIVAEDEFIYPDKMTLSWNAVDGADGYNLYIYSKNKKDYVLWESTEALLSEVTGLRPGTDYYFRIKTYSGESKAEGTFSQTFTFTTDRLPTTNQQATEGFIDTLSGVKKSDGSFTLKKVFSATVSDYTDGTPQSVIDFLSARKTDTYNFENGSAVSDGKEYTVNDVIYPFGKESGLTWSCIEQDSVTYSQYGYGYSVSFSVQAEDSEKISLLTDIAQLREEIPGFVLNSFKTGNAVTEAKVIEDTFEYIVIEVPVEMVFIIDGEKYTVEYTTVQKYLFP